MPFTVEATAIPEVLVVRPRLFGDERGWFTEVLQVDAFAELGGGLPTSFVQVNQSRSARGVIRGLHFQWDPPQAKLMRVVRGRAFMVAVDIRPGSPTLGQVVTVEGSEDEPVLFWAPASFARGFCALADVTEIEYFCTAPYNPALRVRHPLGRPGAGDRVAGGGAVAVAEGRGGGHARGLAGAAGGGGVPVRALGRPGRGLDPCATLTPAFRAGSAVTWAAQISTFGWCVVRSWARMFPDGTAIIDDSAELNVGAMTNKSAGIAALLSFIFPGLGHLYLGLRRQALIFAVPAILVAVVIGLDLLSGPESLLAFVITPSGAMTALALVLVTGGWRLIAMIDAVLVVRRRQGLSARALVVPVILGVLLVTGHGAAGYVAYGVYDAGSRIFVGAGPDDQDGTPAPDGVWRPGRGLRLAAARGDRRLQRGPAGDAAHQAGPDQHPADRDRLGGDADHRPHRHDHGRQREPGGQVRGDAQRAARHLHVPDVQRQDLQGQDQLLHDLGAQPPQGLPGQAVSGADEAGRVPRRRADPLLRRDRPRRGSGR